MNFELITSSTQSDRHRRPAVNQQVSLSGVKDIWQRPQSAASTIARSPRSPPAVVRVPSPRPESTPARSPIRLSVDAPAAHDDHTGTNALIYGCLQSVVFSIVDPRHATPPAPDRPGERAWSPRHRLQPSHVFLLVPPTAPAGRDLRPIASTPPRKNNGRSPRTYAPCTRYTGAGWSPSFFTYRRRLRQAVGWWEQRQASSSKCR